MPYRNNGFRWSLARETTNILSIGVDDVIFDKNVCKLWGRVELKVRRATALAFLNRMRFSIAGWRLYCSRRLFLFLTTIAHLEVHHETLLHVGAVDVWRILFSAAWITEVTIWWFSSSTFAFSGSRFMQILLIKASQSARYIFQRG